MPFISDARRGEGREQGRGPNKENWFVSMKFHRNLPGQRIGRLRSYPSSTKSAEAEWAENSLLDSEQNGLSDFPELYGENSRFIQFGTECAWDTSLGPQHFPIGYRDRDIRISCRYTDKYTKALALI